MHHLDLRLRGAAYLWQRVRRDLLQGETNRGWGGGRGRGLSLRQPALVLQYIISMRHSILRHRQPNLSQWVLPSPAHLSNVPYSVINLSYDKKIMKLNSVTNFTKLNWKCGVQLSCHTTQKIPCCQVLKVPRLTRTPGSDLAGESFIRDNMCDYCCPTPTVVSSPSCGS